MQCNLEMNGILYFKTIKISTILHVSGYTNNKNCQDFSFSKPWFVWLYICLSFLLRGGRDFWVFSPSLLSFCFEKKLSSCAPVTQHLHGSWPRLTSNSVIPQPYFSRAHRTGMCGHTRHVLEFEVSLLLSLNKPEPVVSARVVIH